MAGGKKTGMLKVLKEKKFIDAEMAGYITDKIIEVLPNLRKVLGEQIKQCCFRKISIDYETKGTVLFLKR